MKIIKQPLTLFFFYCSINSLVAQEPIIVDIKSGIENRKEVYVSAITDNIQYLPLETTNDNLISYIHTIKITSEFIFVRTFNPIALYRFARNGKFLNKIGTLGRGPNEYSYMAGFGVNEQENEVYLYALEPSRILVYNFDGVFKGKLTWQPNEEPDNFSDCACDIEFLSDNNFIIMNSNGRGNTPFNYKIFSKKNTLITKAIQPLQFQMRGAFGTANEFSYFKINDNLFVKENLLNDTLYLVSPTLEFIPQYIFKAGKYSCPVKFRQEFMSFMERNDLKYFQPKYIFDCNNSLIFFFIFNKKEFSGYYNKETNETYTFDSKGLLNDIDGGIYYKPIYQNNNELVGYINAMELISYINSIEFKNSVPKYPERKKELEKLVDSLNVNDNPVLMLVKLKE